MEVSSIEVDVTIVQGRDLVAKDKNFLGNKTTSDPYIKVYHDGQKQYETQCVEKSLDPQWNESMKIHTKKIKGESSIVFRIFDRDLMSDDDNMGTVTIPLPDFTQTSSAPPPSTKWYAVEKGEEGDPYYCKKAKGEVQISLAVSVRKLLSIKRGNSKSFFGTIQLQLNWDLEAQSTDLDTSCVAIDGYGKILMDETVYFGDLVNSNGSITHSGDSLTGGRGKGEVITCKLDRIKRHVKALYFILSVATPGRTFEAVESSEVLVRDVDAGMDVCRFTPTFHGKNTSMFLMRLARIGGSWKLTVIEDTDHTARDFGSLIPEIKSYSRDIVPGIVVDPRERVAIMRKGGIIRLDDYARDRPAPTSLIFGLAWDITNGKNIDLDASVICLDSSRKVVDIISYKKLQSDDYSIRHGGDEREGDAYGDDEKIYLNLRSVDSKITYIAFVINSFSGQELDDVSKTSCHLFDSKTRNDLASYKLSNNGALDGFTGLVVGCLYREVNDGRQQWFLRIISEPAQGHVAKLLADEVQRFLKKNPSCGEFFSSPPNPENVENAMPEDVEIDVPPM